MHDQIQMTSHRQLVIVSVLAILSLVAAVVLFYCLDSFAEVQNKAVSLGGAAAGFVVLFILFRSTYFRLTNTDSDLTVRNSEERIQSLEDQLQAIVRSKLENFIVPSGYKAEISKEFRFGFCYPHDWEFDRFPEQTMYGMAIDRESAKNEGFGTNLNVVISDIGHTKSNLNELFENATQVTLDAIAGSELISKERILLNGLEAARTLIHFTSGTGHQLASYQILVVDKGRNFMYAITFTSLVEEFESLKTTFDNIASTFRI